MMMMMRECGGEFDLAVAVCLFVVDVCVEGGRKVIMWIEKRLKAYR